MRWTLLPAALLAATSLSARAQDSDPWFGRDKTLHFGVSLGLAGGAYGASALVLDSRPARVAVGAGTALSLGIAKELYDEARGSHASLRDLTWDVAGAATGVLIAWIIDELIAG